MARPWANPPDDGQQGGGLTHTISAEQADHLTGTDSEVDLVEDLSGQVARRNGTKLEEGLGRLVGAA